MNKVIEVRRLVREFVTTEGIIKKKKRIIKALKGINFNVEKGEIFGLLGPNGAGKTTTIKILTTLLYPTEGEVKIFGKDIVKENKYIRPRINFIFGGERSLYWRLSAEDNLKYFADLYKIDTQIQRKRIPELLNLVGLTERAKSKVETFSKGMKQRLHIARGLINDPEIIFLDEPTIGLDPEVSLDVRSLIMNLKAEGKTILLTTHYMLEADQLCDRIAILNNGKFSALDTPQGLKELTQGMFTLEFRVFGLSHDIYTKLGLMKGIEAVNLYNLNPDQILSVQVKDPDLLLKSVINYLEENNVKIINVVRRDASLEDAYLKLVGGVV